jgi:citrate lyase subunit beta/citryl-CoA lyase
MRIERSVLSVPGSNWKMIQKGVASEADVALLDLLDAECASLGDNTIHKELSRSTTLMAWGNIERSNLGTVTCSY